SAQSAPTELVQSVQLSGPQSASFQVIGDQCTGQAVAGTCAVTVAFAPASVGTAAATLRVVGAAGTQDVALAGTGSVTGPALAAVPAAVDFGDVYPSSATVRTVTVSNSGDVPVSVDGVGVTGAQAAAFAIDSDGCGAHTVAPGDGCSLVVRFVRGSSGPSSAQLHLTLGGAPAIDIALRANLVNLANLVAPAPPATATMFGPVSWTAFKLTSVTGRHKTILIKLYTSLEANVRLTVLRKGAVVARTSRVVPLGATTLRWRSVRPGRYVVKAEGRRMADVRRSSRSVTVTR
ncbi:MAG: choice-of-anchor D domain-containing protein, partial [Solirubrobacteraceae bacterium]